MSNDNREFPHFWWDSNQWFGPVRGMADFENLLRTGGQPRDVILGGRECVRDVGLPKFGLRVECVGDRTLGEFLAEHGVDLPE